MYERRVTRSLRPGSLFLGVLLLHTGCGSTPPPPIPPELTQVDAGMEEGLANAKAVAEHGIPSPTAELDMLQASAARVTPQLGLKELLGAIDAPLPPPTLRSGDQVQIDVLERPELGGLRAVSPDGRVDIPVLGAITAGGLTTTEFATKLARELEEKLLKQQAHVSVRMTAMAQRSVKVLGRVRSHTLRAQTGLGTSVVALPPERPISIYGLLTLVQGLDEDADGNHLTLLRKRSPDAEPDPSDEGRGRRCYHFGFEDLVQAHLSGLEAWLEPDDELIVPRLPDVFVYGAVLQPGRFPLRAGTTVAALLLRAGGARPDADERGSRLLVGQNDNPVELGAMLEPGQVVFVPARRRVYVIGRGVARNGPLPLPATGMTALQALGEAGWFTLDGDQGGVLILRNDRGRLVQIPVPVVAILDGQERDPPLRPGDTLLVPEAFW